MERMKFETPDMVAGNVEKIGALFPNCITEALDEEKSTPEKKVYKKAVNFELLKQMLSPEALAGDEAYEFTWVGKKAAIVEANKPIRATLLPCPEESVNWDTTENLYIEGDNLQVLKLLQESYLGKVKMIYIDPPYNTGNDFIYRDNYTTDSEEYQDEQGLFDEEENRLFHNTDSNGRFHSDWCSMLYSRLILTRNILSDDGVIFISIGQAELENMVALCNEVFGKTNQLGIISRQMKTGGGSQGKYFSHNIDYVVIYAKQYDVARYFRGSLDNEIVSKVYNQIETKGDRKGEYYRTMGLYQSSLGVRPSLRYYIRCPDGTFVIPPGTTFPNVIEEGKLVAPISTDGVWRWSYGLYQAELAKGNIEFKRTENGVLLDENQKPAKWNVYTKIWLSDRQEEGTIPSDLITKHENRHSSKELNALGIPFDFAKPIGLIHYLISIMQQEKDIIIMDFFSGSATTAHAVMQLNAEDGGHRKFVMVQLPEKCDESSEAYKAGYKTICDIGKERIRRAGKKIRAEAPLTTQDLDIGFRVLKLDSSNMKDVYYSPAEVTQAGLFDMVSNIKEDRNDLDLLFGCLIDWGLPLSLPYTSEQIEGCTVHTYNDGDLIACFNENIPDSVIREIARRKPLRAVFRDSSFADSPAKINVFEIFKLLAPDASVKVI